MPRRRHGRVTDADATSAVPSSPETEEVYVVRESNVENEVFRRLGHAADGAMGVQAAVRGVGDRAGHGLGPAPRGRVPGVEQAGRDAGEFRVSTCLPVRVHRRGKPRAGG